jgi:hypothetical protein
MAGPYWSGEEWRGRSEDDERSRLERERWSGPERGWRERHGWREAEPGWPERERWAGGRSEPGPWREVHPGRWPEQGRGRADDPRVAPQEGSRDDGGWTGGVRGNEGGGGYGRSMFGTAYALYAGRDETRGTRPSGRAPKSYQRSDERILDEIVERLMWSGVDAADAEIRVEKGEVTLTGAVARREDKRRIEDVCEDVHGVHDVHNQLRVDRSAAEHTDRTH